MTSVSGFVSSLCSLVIVIKASRLILMVFLYCTYVCCRHQNECCYFKTSICSIFRLFVKLFIILQTGKEISSKLTIDTLLQMYGWYEVVRSVSGLVSSIHFFAIVLRASCFIWVVCLYCTYVWCRHQNECCCFKTSMGNFKVLNLSFCSLPGSYQKVLALSRGALE